MGTRTLPLFFAILGFAAAVATTASADVGGRPPCLGENCQPANNSERCTDMVLPPQGHPAGWDLGMDPDVDRRNYGGTVIAYQIQWFNGSWSGWYFKNQNDLDWKTNEGGGSRRVWSYFTDHTHRVMLCR